MKRDWPLWVQEQDRRIKSAQGNLVKIDIQKINLKQIPRAVVVEVADIARRLNLSYLILRIMYPYFNSVTKLSTPLSDRELALYALGLARIGAHSESADILIKIITSTKSILLLKASALVSQWNYKKAQQIYKQILKTGDLTEYESLIAKINLASCLVHIGKYKNAIEILKEFDSFKDSYKLLYGNSLELLAQAHLGNNSYKLAEDSVIKSINILDDGDSDYSLFAKKWLLIIHAFQKKFDPLEWSKIKNFAIKVGDFETRRDLDLYHACITKNKDSFLKVYFGTPIKSYRDRAYKKFGKNIEFPKTLQLTLNEFENSKCILDLAAGIFRVSEITTNIPKGILVFLRALCNDLYRPIPIGELFSIVYPNEKFDVYSSPHRLFQRVRLIRNFLTSKNIPILITMKNKSYSLNLQIHQIRIGLNYRNIPNSSIDGELMKVWFKGLSKGHFTRKDLEQQLGLSKATAIKYLNEALNKKWLRRVGDGNHYTYFLLPKAYK